MNERTFFDTTISCNGIVTGAMRISCACCDVVAYFPYQSGVHRLAAGAAKQYFLGKGWFVGAGPEADFCPSHARQSKRKDGTATNNSNAPVAEKPREMSREDRRIISEKLDEVYGKDAYKGSWTDSTVARSLDVPRAWVAQVREQFFGPQGSNGVFDEFLAEKSKIAAEFNAISAAARADRQAIAQLIEQSNAEYLAKYADLERRMGDLALVGRRIEREIGR